MHVVSNKYYVALCSVLLVSFLFGAYALEVFGVKYVSEGGSPIFKIHAYSYVILAVFSFYFLRYGLQGISRHLGVYFKAWLMLLLAIIYTIVYGLFKYGMSGMAYVVDTLLVPVLIFPLACLLSQKQSWSIIKLLSILLVINCFASVYEYITSSQIFAYEYEEHWVYFRSTAFLSHPLSNALITSFLAIVLFRTGVINAFLLFVLAALALFCFGARTATAVFLVFAIIELVQLYRERYKQSKGFSVTDLLIMKVGLGFGLFIVLYAVFVLGFGQRIFENIAFDGSARTRYDVFQVFDYLSFDEYLFGASSEFFDNIMFYIDNAVVENYLIGWFLLYGIFGSGFLICAYFYLFYTLFKQANRTLRIATLTFLMISISNNSLSSKNPALLYFFVAFAVSSRTANLRAANMRFF